jgi:hypothetical protein
MMIPIAEARALIVAQRGGSVGAAQKTLRQAGVSGEVRGQGVHLGMPYQITAGDWTAEINFEAGIFDYYCGALGKAAFGKIGEAKVDEDDLIAWLGVKPRGYRMSPEQTAVEAFEAWFKALPAEPRRAKDNLFVEAKTLFPNLSRRAFDAIWREEAPKRGWNKPGVF